MHPATINDARSRLKATSIQDIANNNPESTRFFESLGLDFQADGCLLLADACRKNEVSETHVLNTLMKIRNPDISDSEAYDKWSPTKLIDNIINVHQRCLKKTTARIMELLRKARHPESGSHSETSGLYYYFHLISAYMDEHFRKENEVLFPHIIRFESAEHKNEKISAPVFGSLKNAFREFGKERHAQEANILELRTLTNQYTLPEENAGTVLRQLYTKLKSFEEEFRLYSFLNDEVLFHKAIELEQRLLSNSLLS